MCLKSAPSPAFSVSGGVDVGPIYCRRTIAPKTNTVHQESRARLA